MAVTNCNIDMESLISDQNRSIATLAITTLLKTGNESSVDKLLKQIGSFMSDIAGVRARWAEPCQALPGWHATCCQAPLDRSHFLRVLHPPSQLHHPRHSPADDFKIVVVEAIRSLCLKFPAKYRALMNFLSSVLREEGGFDYKKAIVSSILQVRAAGRAAGLAGCPCCSWQAACMLLGAGRWEPHTPTRARTLTLADPSADHR
jgi:coatomer protein complex subunit gamma